MFIEVRRDEVLAAPEERNNSGNRKFASRSFPILHAEQQTIGRSRPGQLYAYQAVQRVTRPPLPVSHRRKSLASPYASPRSSCRSQSSGDSRQSHPHAASGG